MSPREAREAARPATPADDRWTEFARTRDPALRDELVAAHLDLVRRLARRFANRGESYDDLVQVGSLALIKAVDRFDPERRVEFATYATGTIVGELKRHFRDRGWSVRAPRRVQELYLELGRAIEEASQRLGRSPTVAELAESTGATEEAVLEAMEAGQGYRSASLDAPGPSGTTAAEHLSQDDAGLAGVEERSVLGPAVAALPERNREILRLRFVEGLTQSEIAQRIGVSQMHVSRLLATSLKLLRSRIGDEHSLFE